MKLTGTYVFGVLSCWYYGTTIWVGLFWPCHIGLLFLESGG